LNLERGLYGFNEFTRGCKGFDRGLSDLAASRGGLASLTSPTQINANNKIAGFFAADNYTFAGAVAA
jgi:hypothetical protein